MTPATSGAPDPPAVDAASPVGGAPAPPAVARMATRAPKRIASTAVPAPRMTAGSDMVHCSNLIADEMREEHRQRVLAESHRPYRRRSAFKWRSAVYAVGRCGYSAHDLHKK